MWRAFAPPSVADTHRCGRTPRAHCFHWWPTRVVESANPFHEPDAPKGYYRSCRNPGPVNGVDGAQTIAGFEVEIGRQRLHNILAFVEHTCDSQIVNVVVLQRVHLGTLEVAHAAMWRQHEYGDAFFASQSIFGSRTGIARSCTQNIQAGSTLFKHVFEDLAQKLHGHVFEGQCGPLRQTQQAHAMIKRLDRHDIH